MNRLVPYLIFGTGLLFASCAGNSNPNKDSHSIKFQQYYLQGQLLYINHCSNCHQEDGRGLARLYPPLDTSDYMNNRKAVLCGIRKGIQGSIVVNGVEFNQPMPAIPSLTDLEVAEIATYIYNTWSHSEGIIEVKEVSQLLSTCD